MAPHPTERTDVALDLALAVIASSTAPLLLLGADLVLIAASKSFCRAFQIDPTSVAGCALSALGSGEWDVPQLTSLLKATASGHAAVDGYEIDLNRHGRERRRLVMNAQKLEYGGGDAVRLLVSVSDVTDARVAQKLKDDMLKEKAVLLQELQHRVANSLQIIASVLMQSARKVQSDETRSHLHDAHQRVMSVAALQQQLAATTTGNVELRPYFTTLCNSIGASMIRDHNQLSLDVSVDDSVTSADVSVSLGLIVTELVINALKHAFPGDRNGKIKVDYRAHGPNWTLSIIDDGVGMPKDAANSKPGLGTSIVQALTAQLHAQVKVADANPGTAVSIAHTQLAVVRSGNVAATDRRCSHRLTVHVDQQHRSRHQQGDAGGFAGGGFLLEQDVADHLGEEDIDQA
jgi:two-component system, sensor histidine kinase PdtaS